MREIKFRAWDVKNKKMLYFEDEWFEQEHFGKEIVRATMYVPTFGSVDSVFRINYFDRLGKYDFSVQEIKAIPLQFTGLKDKNGVEIYEGDLIEVSDFNGNPVRKQIKWNTRYAGFDIDSGLLVGCEVIGNIYENPELIKN